jgi:hypothetical protein
MSEQKIIEVYPGHHVGVETPFTREWETRHRHRWVEINGMFYPRGTVVEQADGRRRIPQLPAGR